MELKVESRLGWGWSGLGKGYNKESSNNCDVIKQVLDPVVRRMEGIEVYCEDKVLS